MSMYPDEPVGMIANNSTSNHTIHTAPEECPYASDDLRPTQEDDLRVSCRLCTWCYAHG